MFTTTINDTIFCANANVATDDLATNMSANHDAPRDETMTAAGLANLVGRVVTPMLLAPAALLTVIGWQTEPVAGGLFEADLAAAW